MCGPGCSQETGTLQTLTNLPLSRDSTSLVAAACSYPQWILQTTWQAASCFSFEESDHSLFQLNPTKVAGQGWKMSTVPCLSAEFSFLSRQDLCEDLFFLFSFVKGWLIPLERNREGRQELDRQGQSGLGTMHKRNCFGRTDEEHRQATGSDTALGVLGRAWRPMVFH